MPLLEAVAKLKDIVEDETGISVDIEMYEETAVVEKVSFDLASGAGIYDIVKQPFGKLGKLVESNWLTPLDVFLELISELLISISVVLLLCLPFGV